MFNNTYTENQGVFAKFQQSNQTTQNSSNDKITTSTTKQTAPIYSTNNTNACKASDFYINEESDDPLEQEYITAFPLSSNANTNTNMDMNIEMEPQNNIDMLFAKGNELVNPYQVVGKEHKTNCLNFVGQKIALIGPTRRRPQDNEATQQTHRGPLIMTLLALALVSMCGCVILLVIKMRKAK